MPAVRPLKDGKHRQPGGVEQPRPDCIVTVVCIVAVVRLSLLNRHVSEPFGVLLDEIPNRTVPFKPEVIHQGNDLFVRPRHREPRITTNGNRAGFLGEADRREMARIAAKALLQGIVFRLQVSNETFLLLLRIGAPSFQFMGWDVTSRVEPWRPVVASEHEAPSVMAPSPTTTARYDPYAVTLSAAGRVQCGRAIARNNDARRDMPKHPQSQATM